MYNKQRKKIEHSVFTGKPQTSALPAYYGQYGKVLVWDFPSRLHSRLIISY